MSRHLYVLGLLAGTAIASPALAGPLGDIFVIDMENHNFTQPNSTALNTVDGKVGGVSQGIQQLKGNIADPYLNSLITKGDPNAAQTSWASNYHNVLAPVPDGATAQHVHPSEPNYLWQEGGSNFGIQNDNSVAVTTGNTIITQNGAPLQNGQMDKAPSLSGLLQNKGIAWKSYQEDTGLLTTGGKNGTAGSGITNGAVNAVNGTNNLTSTAVDPSQYTVPLVSISGTSSNYTNAYNGSHQYDFATKHGGSLFFDATNGITNHSVNGGVTTNAAGTGTQDAANPLAKRYAPLQQLTNDLNNNTVGRYNLISPDQFNDMHTALATGFNYKGLHFSGDQASIAQGDNFLSILVPQIMASQAYKNNGAIIIWFDETEASAGTPNPDTLATTLAEIVISPLAKGDAFESTLNYTHSSDLKTLQEVFGVADQGLLGDAATPGTNDLSDLFVPGAIPEPMSATLLATGLVGLGILSRRRALLPAAA